MTDIVARFRDTAKIKVATISDSTLYNTYITSALARLNAILDTSHTVDSTTYTSGNDVVDLAVMYLTCSEAYKTEFMRRIVEDVEQWYRFEQMAYCIMSELDPSKIGQRPGGEYYLRYKNKGIPADVVQIAETT